MSRTSLACAAFVLLAGCAHTDAPKPGSEPRSIPLVEYVQELRTIAVTVDGREYNFLFDTGGGYTLVSPEISDALDCQPSGKLTGFRMSGERVDFGKCGDVELQIGSQSRVVEAGVFDINSLIPSTLPKLYGVLSMHTFADGILTLDLANEKLVVETAESLRERVRDMQPIDASFYNELEGRGMDVYLQIGAGDRHVNLLFDSGNLGSNVLTPQAWQEVSGDAPPAKGVEQELVLWFGKAVERRLPFASRDIIREGALNVDFVRSGIFTFDFPNRRAWVKWNVAEVGQEKTGTAQTK